jgi:HlyD family secretion protein
MRRGVLVALIAAVAVVAYLLWPSSGAEQPKLVTSVVERGPITASVTATGTVNPVETVQVGTYVSGPIQDILADYNTPVKRGQLLAKIDSRPFQMKVDGAEADVANAKARVAKAKADRELKSTNLRRSRELVAQGIVSRSEFDAATSDAKQAEATIALEEAGLASSEAKLQDAKVSLAYTDIVAPVDGVVVARNVSKGQTVAASFQTPTLFLVAADLKRMEVNASVSESDIGGVAVGQDVAFTVDAYPGQPFKGRVTQVRNSPITVANVVTYEVLVAVDNAELKLKPGMTANVTITTATRDDAIRVPTSALRFRPPPDLSGAAETPPPRAGSTVWTVAAGDRLDPVTVTTGIADERFTEIVSGLEPGTRVVTAIERDPDAGAQRPQLPTFGAGGGGRRR